MDIDDQVIHWLGQQGVPAYLVGGAVRDRLLGTSAYDLDAAVDGDGLAVARQLANHFGGVYFPLDEDRSTGRAILQTEDGQRLVVDVARFRGADLDADLADRDFTVNAMAVDVHAPAEVIDRHGGLDDLAAGVIRPVSDASIRNDPLRALRAVRLAAQLGFRLAPETESLIRRDGGGLTQVTEERTRDELAHLLALVHAAPHLARLDELGLLTLVLPELEPLRDLAQPPPHCLDGMSHSLETVRRLETIVEEQPGASDPRFYLLVPLAGRLREHLAQVLSDERSRLVTLKLAALLHDTGKPATHAVDDEGRIRTIDHDKIGAQITGDALRRLRFSRTEVRLAVTIVRHHMRPLLLANEVSVSSRAVYRFFRDTDDAGVDILLHALADHRATYAPGAEDDRWPHLVDLVARMLTTYWERQAEKVTPPRLVDGHDLLQQFELEPGPLVGELLEAVREAQVSGEVRTRGEALDLVREKLGKEA
jgi:putative nucleotidyltransferase with HDIG domain